jgi:hypothetical protein
MGLRRRSLTVFLACLPVVLLLHAPVDAQSPSITAFTLDSEPLDYVGQGRSQVLTPSNAEVDAVVSQDSVTLTAEAGSASYTARITPPRGQTLVPGEYSTMRFADDTHAGLDVSGDGRGCNTSSGVLTIHRIVALPVVEEFSATYLQLCDPLRHEGGLSGELRYNTSMGYKAASAPNEAVFNAEDPLQTIVFESTGSDPVTVKDVIFMVSPSDFTIETDTCSGVAISPGETCGVGIRYQVGGPALDKVNLRFHTDAYRHVRYVALSGVTHPGGGPPGSEGSLRATVVKTRLFGEYARRGKYELFHVREGVLQAGFLSPRNAGNRLNFEIQIRRGGWKTYATDSFRIRRGVSGATFGARRGIYRANNSFAGNNTFAPSTSAWQYFKITA